MADWPKILAEHGNRVWRTAYRILAHAADTQDCYQDTFLAAWKLASQKRIYDWAPMLVCLATRKAIDRLRQRMRIRASSQPLAVELEPATEADPASSLRMEELVERVRQGLTELSEKQAEVVWLRLIEDLTPQEIARHLQISGGEVRVLLHRGRVRLSQHLASELTDTQELP